ncbi:B12-binding domain-containing protein [Desulfosporosinus fructosivorans]
MQEVIRLFEKEKYFLPEVLISSDAYLAHYETPKPLYCKDLGV